MMQKVSRARSGTIAVSVNYDQGGPIKLHFYANST